MKIGLLVNPIAGMGGSVGLKGTDKQVKQALALGSTEKANRNALKAIKEIKIDSETEVTFYTGSGLMGEDVLSAAQIDACVYPVDKNRLEEYNREDTKKLCRYFIENQVDLILFAGGDGTARDVFDTIKDTIPCIGIPTGVKMQSAVFALRPNMAGDIANDWIHKTKYKTTLKEVIDLDEKQYRNNKISATLYGYLQVPFDPSKTQNKKAPSAVSDENNQHSIALDVIDTMEKDVIYIIGPGTTPNAILKALSIEGTLLGFDIILNHTMLEKDVNEKRILQFLSIYQEKKTKIILTPIGGQGFLLGRGNQQISASVLSHLEPDDIIIVATKNKMAQLESQPFIIDVENDEINEMFSGYYKVITAYNETMMYNVRV